MDAPPAPPARRPETSSQGLLKGKIQTGVQDRVSDFRALYNAGCNADNRKGEVHF